MQRPSIHTLDPLEVGGVANRIGIDFQDHVAAGLCIQMLQDPMITAVWCETQDDITVIRQIAGLETVEFVQVKADEMDQLWSVAKVCGRENEKEGTSILERSLAYDRCVEDTCFRFVTRRPAQNIFDPLKTPRGSAYRLPTNPSFNRLQSEIKSKINGYKSDNGNDCTYWLIKTLWEERHSTEALKSENIYKLRQWIEAEGYWVATDQASAIYDKILRLVWVAGLANSRLKPVEKKILSVRFKTEIVRYVHESQVPASNGTGARMREKMSKAGLPYDIIASADELRRQYRLQSLSPQYLASSARRDAEAEAVARLTHLRNKLDNNKLNASETFYSRCLEVLEHVAEEFRLGPSGLSYMHGFMCNLTDRCVHRFEKIA